jgi:hypothetical protein
LGQLTIAFTPIGPDMPSPARYLGVGRNLLRAAMPAGKSAGKNMSARSVVSLSSTTEATVSVPSIVISLVLTRLQRLALVLSSNYGADLERGVLAQATDGSRTRGPDDPVPQQDISGILRAPSSLLTS